MCVHIPIRTRGARIPSQNDLSLLVFIIYVANFEDRTTNNVLILSGRWQQPEKKMQHREYFQHVFENKLNLVYVGILVHTQCKIVHTLN